MEAHLFRVFRRLQHTHQHTVSDPWAGRLDMFYLFYLCGCFLLHSHFHSITSHSSPLLPPFPSESGLVIFLFDLCIYPPLIPLLLWHPSAGALKECTPPQNTAWSSSLLSSPPPLIFHPSPPPSTSMLCACATSSPKMICAVYIHPSPPRLYPLLQLIDVKNS